MTPPFGAAAAPALGPATEQYASRYGPHFEPGFYRPTSMGLTISALGVGTYLGGCTDEEDQAYAEVIGTAIERGINCFDTAPNYRAQRSERAVGAAVRAAIASGAATRSELVISTKGGYLPLDKSIPSTKAEYQQYLQRVFYQPGIVHPDEVVAGAHSLAPRFLKYSIATSRQNLGVRTIDLYYLHNPEQQLSHISRDVLRERLRTAFLTLEEAVVRGEIAQYGCATWAAFRVPPGDRDYLSLNWLVSTAKEVGGESHHFRAIQLPVSLAAPEAVRDAVQPIGSSAPLTAVQAAGELGLTVIASAPLMQGRLSDGLPAAVREHFPGRRSDAQRALAFVRGLPGVASALVGTRRMAHLVENLASAAPEGELDADS